MRIFLSVPFVFFLFSFGIFGQGGSSPGASPESSGNAVSSSASSLSSSSAKPRSGASEKAEQKKEAAGNPLPSPGKPSEPAASPSASPVRVRNVFYRLNRDKENLGAGEKFIRLISFKTNPAVLASFVKIEQGEVFPSSAALDQSLQNEQIALENLRLFKRVLVEAQYNETQSEADVYVHIQDTGNTYLLPRIKYSSSSGFSGGAKLGIRNFFGTFTNLTFGLNIDDDSTDFDLNLSRIPLGPLLFNLSLNQSYGRKIGQTLDASTSLSFGTSVPFLRYFSYSPSISLSFPYRYEFPDNRLNLLPRKRGEPSLGFGNSLSYSRLQWRDNFKRGWNASLSASLSYTFKEPKPSLSLSAFVAGFWDLRYIGLHAALRSELNVLGSGTGLESAVRGLNDSLYDRKWGTVLNLEMQVPFFRFPKFVDVFLIFFSDLSYITPETTLPSIDYFDATAGTSMQVSFLSFGSLTMTLEIGFDLRRFRFSQWNGFQNMEVKFYLGSFL